MSTPPVILWFRSDLRLHDNTALNAALSSRSPVIPIFILDPAIRKSNKTGAPRMAFLIKALRSLDQSLREQGAALIVLEGDPVKVLARLVSETGAAVIYCNRDYSPYARRRDDAVEAELRLGLQCFDDSLLVAPGDVLKADETPYTVFTPFKKRWLRIPKAVPQQISLDSTLWRVDLAASTDLDSLSVRGTIPVPQASEVEAQRGLADFIDGPIYAYADGRNRLAASPDDPVPGTSYLSAYFHLGLLSIREAYHAAESAGQSALDHAARESVDTWISELCWREFYQHILFHFPQVALGNFRAEYDALPWRDAPDDLQAWKEGRTGYPVVDAAMRQLYQVGWMPNRARMIVASFLTKDLLIDWREGERHFMQWLIDGDLAANNGGWQWAAGTGTDAQPYFRIFNPVLQSRKFGREGHYIRTWVPELRRIRHRL
jgi:deoxyribodipyrimidine photo-lyase